jgi:hypothetical protein
LTIFFVLGYFPSQNFFKGVKVVLGDQAEMKKKKYCLVGFILRQHTCLATSITHSNFKMGRTKNGWDMTIWKKKIDLGDQARKKKKKKKKFSDRPEIFCAYISDLAHHTQQLSDRLDVSWPRYGCVQTDRRTGGLYYLDFMHSKMPSCHYWYKGSR